MLKILKSRKTKSVVIILLLALSIIHTIYPRLFNKSAEVIRIDQPGLYKVIHFKDGDTIVVDMQGTPETVRFIGVDTPETHKPNTPVQCYGPAASAHTKILIGNSKVRLESDPLSTDRDRYNRLLRYVFLPGGRLVNEDLIQNGYGFYYPYFPFTKSEQFSQLQSEAQTLHKGLWGNCNPTRKGAGYQSNSAG